jgi:hypothetical protein
MFLLSFVVPAVLASQVIRLTEDDTTSSSRIFIKILFQVGGTACGTGGWYMRYYMGRQAVRLCLGTASRCAAMPSSQPEQAHPD